MLSKRIGRGQGLGREEKQVITGPDLDSARSEGLVKSIGSPNIMRVDDVG